MRADAIQLLVPNSTGYDVHPGTGAMGSFSIADVPADTSTAMLRWNQNFFDHPAPGIDVGDVYFGRASAYSATTPSPLTFSLGLAIPWNSSMSVMLLSTNAGALFQFIEQVGNYKPADGTAHLDFSADFSKADRPWLIDAAAGDTVQLSLINYHATSTGMDAWTTDQTATTSFTQTNGGNATVTATTQTVPQNHVVQLGKFKASAFIALAGQVGPGAAISNAGVDVAGTVTGSGLDGIFVARAQTATPPTMDQSIGALTYGWPFGSNVSPVLSAWATYAVPVTAPGGASTTFYATVATYDPLSATTMMNADATPRLSPVTSIQANGQSMGTSLSGIGLNPKISWTPGSIGTATEYWVLIYEIDGTGASTTLNSVGSVATTQTSIVMPPYILKTGTHYVLDVVAQSVPGHDVTRAPFKTQALNAWADSLTASFTP
jgi:hypothetical protein